MNRKIIMIIPLLIVVLIAAAYLIMIRPVPQATLFVDPESVHGTVGQDFTIGINTSNVANLYSYGFRLRWNSSILDAVTVSEGSFLRSGGSTFFFPRINATEGYLVVYSTLLEDVLGVGGHGTLATVQFHVKGNGTCTMDLDDTVLIDSAEDSIKHIVNWGHFGT